MTSVATLAPSAPTVTWTPRLWGALIVLCGALFLDGLDISMVGVALPSIAGELGLNPSSLQWIVSGYILGYGGLLLLGGRTADLLGRRRVFLIALAVFAAASLLGGLVSDPTLLIATRFIKGVAAAFTAPAGLSIITTTFPEGPARNRALSIYAGFGATGFSSGLILGGLMTSVGWRWTFLLPVPIALGVLAFGARLIPRDHAPENRGGYDVAGAVTSTAGLLILVYAVVRAPTVGWLAVSTVLELAVAVALLAAFVVIELRAEHPLVRFGIFRNRSVVSANLAAMSMFGSYVGFQFIGTMYMQSLLGWSPLSMALAFLPAGLMVAVGAPRAGFLVNRFGAGKVVAAGFVFFVVGYALFLRIGAEPHYVSEVLPSIICLGFGFALAFPTLNIQATTGVVDSEQGLASGLVQTSMQVGGAIVIAAVTAVIASAGKVSTPREVLDSYYPALTVVTAVAIAGLAFTTLGLRKTR
ncbi:MFS transporter [Longispora sp. K20-0274]|uniref:MFS transporter n=1 Tax=Longispora sp. K20-0274 TaxID=3088255 RepID=UPI0039997CB5